MKKREKNKMKVQQTTRTNNCVGSIIASLYRNTCNKIIDQSIQYIQ